MNKKNRRVNKGRRHPFSHLSEHKRTGRKLLPPLLSFPVKYVPISWKDERLPELLIPVLIISHLERDRALFLFREIGDYLSNLSENEQPTDITISSLSALKPSILESFIDFLLENEDLKVILSPLFLFDNIPRKSSWSRIDFCDNKKKWELLTYAVFTCINHQSQEATDCRWFRLLYQLLREKLHVPIDLYIPIMFYPKIGDMRDIRPSIRAAEGTFDNLLEKPLITIKWNEEFWKKCLEKTPCFPLELVTQRDRAKMITSHDINLIIPQIIVHFEATNSSPLLNEKHDTIFGIALYSMRLIEEIGGDRPIGPLIGRTVLRTLVDCYLSLKYLCFKDDSQLWKDYREYGMGQAKLVYQKCEEKGTYPEYITDEVMRYISNKDRWQEFTPIDLGVWSKITPRKMSEESGIKEIYDDYYIWSSNFAHSMWGAISESVMITCKNPLHQFHMIPNENPPQMSEVTNDIVKIVNSILDVLEEAYPAFPYRLHIS